MNKKHMDEHVSASQILNPKTLHFWSLDILATKYRARQDTLKSNVELPHTLGRFWMVQEISTWRVGSPSPSSMIFPATLHMEGGFASLEK